MDLPDAAEKLKHFKTRYRKLKVIPIGNGDEKGIEKLKATLAELIREVPEQPAAAEPLP
jgi:hypothetical protein